MIGEVLYSATSKHMLLLILRRVRLFQLAALSLVRLFIGHLFPLLLEQFHGSHRESKEALEGGLWC